MKTQIRDILTLEYLTRSGMLCDERVLQLLVKGLLTQDLDTLYEPELEMHFYHDGKYLVDISTDDLVRMRMYVVSEDSDGQFYTLTTHVVGEITYTLSTWTKITSLLGLIE